MKNIDIMVITVLIKCMNIKIIIVAYVVHPRTQP